MKTNRTILIAAAALMLASCADKAKISGTLDGVHNGQLTVKQLDVNKFTILDTIKTVVPVLYDLAPNLSPK